MFLNEEKKMFTDVIEDVPRRSGVEPGDAYFEISGRYIFVSIFVKGLYYSDS